MKAKDFENWSRTANALFINALVPVYTYNTGIIEQITQKLNDKAGCNQLIKKPSRAR